MTARLVNVQLWLRPWLLLTRWLSTCSKHPMLTQIQKVESTRKKLKIGFRVENIEQILAQTDYGTHLLKDWKLRVFRESGTMITVKEGNLVYWLFLSEKTIELNCFIIFYLLKFLHQMWEQQPRKQETLMGQE